MNIFYNNKHITHIIYNGIVLTKLSYNGHTWVPDLKWLRIPRYGEEEALYSLKDVWSDMFTEVLAMTCDTESALAQSYLDYFKPGDFSHKHGEHPYEYSYLYNLDGDLVPVLYTVNEEYPDEPDYSDIYFYDGLFELDGTTYDKWDKYEGTDHKYSILTNRVVEG